ncbi:MAG: hypothetical protein FWD83_00035 [Promicromonosporaceae bacterium]|nr:hypothetical protein [Promicromonosporaceae bacterium]
MILGLLSYGPNAIAVGASALALHGIAGVPLGLAPQITHPNASHHRARDLIDARMFDDGMDVVVIDGWRCASVPWALAQSVPELSRVVAVSCLDSALNKHLLTPDELDAAHWHARGRRGVAKTHSWWQEADGRSESPLETAARLECKDFGIPPDELQLEQVDANGIRRRLDLAWRLPNGLVLAAEIDGREYHSGLEPAYADRARQNALIVGGSLAVLRFTARDLQQRGLIARTVTEALRSTNTSLPHRTGRQASAEPADLVANSPVENQISRFDGSSGPDWPVRR